MAADPGSLCGQKLQWRGAGHKKDRTDWQLSAETWLLQREKTIGLDHRGDGQPEIRLRTVSSSLCWLPAGLRPMESAKEVSQRDCSPPESAGLQKVPTTLPKSYCWHAKID